MLTDLKTILKNSSFTYELISHERPIHSAGEGAAYFGIEMGQTAPTLIIKTHGQYYALIISGERGRADLEQVGRILGYPQVKLPAPGEVRHVTGFSIGSIPLVGLGLPCVLDRRLNRFPFVYGGTGELLITLKIEPAALTELNQVVAFLD